jgi:dihydroorotate dehydrogenase (NAD+) catalytic subunit
VFGTNPQHLAKLVSAVRKVVKGSVLIVKLSPNVTDITQTARAAVESGAECLSLINTLMGMAVNIEKQAPVLANTTGGLSGPAIKPVALNLVHQVCRKVAGPADIPVIGMGGIGSAADAVEFLLAGATAVGIGTALFADPTTPLKVAAGIEDYLTRHSMRSVAELIGQLKSK